MSESTAERAEAVQAVVVATNSSEPAVQRAAMQALIPPPPASQVTGLWMAITVGLLLVLLVSLGGLIYLLADGNDETSPDLALTAFSATLAGLLGLFAPSPANSGD